MFREVEVADGVGDLGEGIGEPFEMFEKEDMSDMFKRAMLEKMGLVGESSFKVTPNSRLLTCLLKMMNPLIKVLYES